MFVRALLHIDARALTFVAGEGGRKTASVDVLGMVFNQEGAEVGHLSTGFAVALTAEAETTRFAMGSPITCASRSRGRAVTRFDSRSAISTQARWVGRRVRGRDDMTGGAFALSGIVLANLRPNRQAGCRRCR